MPAATADQINALLPQTQCRRCGFDGCRPYAQAIHEGLADINRCPPGGEAGIGQLAGLLGAPVKALDPALADYVPNRIAAIAEADCIGCAKCLAACPVDAIVGAPKFMHTVLSAECTGCELCLPPCPVDCIVMRPAPEAASAADKAPSYYQKRYDARCARFQAQAAEDAERMRRQKQTIKASEP